MRQKVNNNQLLEEENLAFIGCGVEAAVVDDDVVVEVDAADRSRRCRGRRVIVVESQPRSEVKLLSSPRALLGSSCC
jgi:hypothetical protein